MNLIKTKKYLILIIVLLSVISASAYFAYDNYKKNHSNEYSIGFSFNDGYNIKIGLGEKENDEFKIDVTDKHVHIGGAGSIVKRMFNYFTGDNSNSETEK